MQHIIKTDNDRAAAEVALQMIPKGAEEIIKSALAPKISNITPIAATDAMIDVFSMATAISGSVTDGDTLIAHAHETYDWLMRLYPEVTLEEIRSAVRAGVYDEYGKYYGLNPKSYVFFVREYLQSEKRRVAKAAYEAAKSKLRALPPKLTEAQYKEWILEDYRIYKEGGSNLIQFVPKKYFMLRKYGFIGLNSRESWLIWLSKSKDDLYGRIAQRAMDRGDKGLLNSIVSITTQLDETGEIGLDELKKIVTNARRLRYLKFLEVMERENIDNFFNQ